MSINQTHNVSKRQLSSMSNKLYIQSFRNVRPPGSSAECSKASATMPQCGFSGAPPKDTGRMAYIVFDVFLFFFLDRFFTVQIKL